MSYVDIEIPEKLQTKTLDFIKSVVAKKGSIKKGMNESTKSLERGVAKMVIIAGDITPAEIVMHLPAICQEKKVPYLFVNTRAELGKAAQISIPCATLAVLDFDKGLDADFKAIVKDVAALRK